MLHIWQGIGWERIKMNFVEQMPARCALKLTRKDKLLTGIKKYFQGVARTQMILYFRNPIQFL
jgi:hypothetical protein